MAINVKHGVAAGPVAAAAFLGGQGRSARGGRSPLGRRRGLRDEEEELRARAAGAGAPAAVDHDKELGYSGGFLATTPQRTVFGNKEEAAAYTAAQEEKARKARMEAGAPSLADKEQIWADRQRLESELRREERQDLEKSLTAKQKQELERLANAEAEALASPDFSDEEKEELRFKFAQRRAGITPVARPKQPTPAELFKNKTYVDPKTGAIYPLDEQGLPGRPIYEPPDKEQSWQDRVKVFEAATKYATKPDGGVDQALFREAMERMNPQAAGQASAYQPGVPQVDPETGLVAKADVSTMQGLESELARIGGSAPRQGALDPEEVNDLQTVDFQLEAARLRLADLEEEAKNPKGSPKEREFSSLRRKFEPGKVKERIKALEARKLALQQQQEELSAKLIARQAARARLGR